ncbi:MAG: putative orfan [Edafosvirus sp.]|uniref:Putative orfan n=1 Tax=Edafosvirus sp. TaxID=2487765 RepID=A0A3G4ZT60_9VIRU|nr:MAG: putative orfan [Edafosvirus sp.]
MSLEELKKKRDKLSQSIEELNKQKDELEDEIKNLTEELTEFDEKIQIDEDTYLPFDIDIKNLPDFVKPPEAVHIYCTSGSHNISYHVEYDGLEFYIRDRPDETYPYSFQVSLNGSIILQNTYPYKGLPNLVKIYYVRDAPDCDSLQSVDLCSFEMLLERAKKIMGKTWVDNMAYGFILMHFWVLFHYKYGYDSNHPNYNIYEIFSKNAY